MEWAVACITRLGSARGTMEGAVARIMASVVAHITYLGSASGTMQRPVASVMEWEVAHVMA